MNDWLWEPLVRLWSSKFDASWKHKKECFQDAADEIMRFYGDSHDFQFQNRFNRYVGGATGGGAISVLGDVQEAPVVAPSMMVTANKTAEFVMLYGPLLYNRNPIRRVRPRKAPEPPPALFGLPDVMPPPPPPGMPLPPDVMALFQAQAQYQQLQQQIQHGRAEDEYRAALLEAYLNYTPRELQLKDHARLAIDEALVKGRGVLWSELFMPAGADFMLVGSFFDSVDNLLIDPDAESLQEAQWIARRCVHPVWLVERLYGYAPGSLRGNMESAGNATQTDGDPEGPYQRRRGETCDLMVYYRVWSRMGCGGRLKGGPNNYGTAWLKQYREFFEQFGDYCHLVIAKTVRHPLNLPPALLDMNQPQAIAEMGRRLSWPIPYWADAPDPWPMTEIDFHPLPRRTWPLPHLKPALGYQKALNWVYSFIISTMRKRSLDFIVTDQALADDVKQRILNPRGDLELIEIQQNHGDTWEKMIGFLKHPEINSDVWKLIEMLEVNFQRATGMSETMYGESNRQMRSAQEAALKGDMTKIRPDDMGNRVEDDMSRVARKEALALRWAADPDRDIAPVLGPIGAMGWKQLVTNKDVPYIVRELEYTVEAGSAKKPNKELDIANTEAGAQFFAPLLFQVYSQTGDPTQVNAFVQEWCKARDFDAEKFMFPPLPTMQPPGGPPPGAGGPPPGGPAPPGPGGPPPGKPEPKGVAA